MNVLPRYRLSGRGRVGGESIAHHITAPMVATSSIRASSTITARVPRRSAQLHRRVARPVARYSAAPCGWAFRWAMGGTGCISSPGRPAPVRLSHGTKLYAMVAECRAPWCTAWWPTLPSSARPFSCPARGPRRCLHVRPRASPDRRGVATSGCPAFRLGCGPGAPTDRSDRRRPGVQTGPRGPRPVPSTRPRKAGGRQRGRSATLEPEAFCTMALHPCRPVRRPRRCGGAVEDHLIDHNGVLLTHGALQDRDLARDLGEGRPSCPNPPKLGPPDCPTRPEASSAQGVRLSWPERCLATASAIWLIRNR
jgi:hypothetical protein